MPITCTKCDGTGFINLHQIPEDELSKLDDDLVGMVPSWIGHNPDTDVSVCDCCGDGEGWYGTPGEHYNSDDQQQSNQSTPTTASAGATQSSGFDDMDDDIQF